jgi:hypothetical protein
MSSATRQVVCLQDYALSKRLEHAERRGCYRLRPDLPTNCGSPAYRLLARQLPRYATSAMAVVSNPGVDVH